MEFKSLQRNYVISLDEESVWAVLDALLFSARHDVALKWVMATIQPNAQEAQALLSRIVEQFQTHVNQLTKEE